MTQGAREHSPCLWRNQQLDISRPRLENHQQNQIQNMDKICLIGNITKKDETAKFDREHLEEVMSINKELLVYAENKEIEVILQTPQIMMSK